MIPSKVLCRSPYWHAFWMQNTRVVKIFMVDLNNFIKFYLLCHMFLKALQFKLQPTQFIMVNKDSKPLFYKKYLSTIQN